MLPWLPTFYQCCILHIKHAATALDNWTIIIAISSLFIPDLKTYFKLKVQISGLKYWSLFQFGATTTTWSSPPCRRLDHWLILSAFSVSSWELSRGISTLGRWSWTTCRLNRKRKQDLSSSQWASKSHGSWQNCVQQWHQLFWKTWKPFGWST